MSIKTSLFIALSFCSLWIGLESGYKIGKASKELELQTQPMTPAPACFPYCGDANLGK